MQLSKAEIKTIIEKSSFFIDIKYKIKISTMVKFHIVFSSTKITEKRFCVI